MRATRHKNKARPRWLIGGAALLCTALITAFIAFGDDEPQPAPYEVAEGPALGLADQRAELPTTSPARDATPVATRQAQSGAPPQQLTSLPRVNLALGPDADIRAALESLGEEALAMKDMLDARDFPESGSCTHVRASSRMQDDASFAASVERVCFYWRTVTFRYVETHADAVNSGDPEAIDEAKRTFQLIELASMRALLEAGGTIIADNTSYDHNTPTQDYR